MSKLLPKTNTSNAKRMRYTTEAENGAAVRPLVLIIDGDEDFAESIKCTLKEHGCNVQVTHDGNTGIASAIARRPDLILLNAQLPKRSGFLVLEYIWTQTNVDCPVIFLGNGLGKRHEKYAKILGVSLYVSKPVSSSELADMVYCVLKNNVAVEGKAVPALA